MNGHFDHEILGIGAPILDHLLHVTDEYLDKLPGEKWGMELVIYHEMEDIIEKSGSIPIQMAGGSCANAIRGLASLGHKCAMTGKIGIDPIGQKVVEDLQDTGIIPYFVPCDISTSHVASFITSDGKRTMRAFVGASGKMSPEDLDPLLFEGVSLVHLEGYTLLCPGLTESAMRLAKNAGAKVSFDLGSFEVVETYRDLILELLPKYVDIVFCNSDEVHAILNEGEEKGCQLLSEMCEIAVVMRGEEGCLVGSKGNIIFHSAIKTNPIDTTGAGDLFASGFLHGYLLGHSLKECAQMGSILAHAVIQVVGAKIPKDTWPELLRKL